MWIPRERTFQVQGQSTATLRQEHTWVSLRYNKEAGWVECSEKQVNSRSRGDQSTSTGGIELTFTEMGKTFRAAGLGLVDFEMPVRYPSGGDMWAEGCIYLKFRSKDVAVDINAIISMQILFKVMRLARQKKKQFRLIPRQHHHQEVKEKRSNHIYHAEMSNGRGGSTGQNQELWLHAVRHRFKAQYTKQYFSI